MDIFNFKRIAELEKTLAEVTRERDEYAEVATELTTKFKMMATLEETTPSDCKKGPWCKACEFSKTFHHIESYYTIGASNMITVYYCGKGESCTHFVQR